MASVETAETNADRFAHVLGLAALDLWSELPRELQQTLFERAVLLGHQTERDESLREQLAQFLHHHHDGALRRNSADRSAARSGRRLSSRKDIKSA